MEASIVLGGHMRNSSQVPKPQTQNCPNYAMFLTL